MDLSDSIKNDDTSKVIQETCAACGKEGNSDDMNTCNKCRMVKYCNAACKKKHRSKHKKKCDRRVAELHDEQLFKEPPPSEECPICMLPMPPSDQRTFKVCCGKLICNGCIHAIKIGEGKDLCPFCRTPPPRSDKEEIIRMKKLADNGNGIAVNSLALDYAHGIGGLPQDWAKAHELYLKAGELGCVEAYFNLGMSYDFGHGVEVDKKKAKHYYELAAIGGSPQARYNLGCDEGNTGNHERAMKHFIIAAKTGVERALKAVKKGYANGVVTKDEYASTLRAYHEWKKEMKSDERNNAAASGWYRSG